MARRRLDAELVRRGLARSREQAQEFISAGVVTVKGAVATKAATQVETSDPVEVVVAEGHGYVSRGAVKLNGALDAFPTVDVTNKYCLDAGASTGGFTQVLLERGAAKVLAVDVGYGQLAWPILAVAERAIALGLGVAGVTASPLPGPSGNVEYFLWLVRGLGGKPVDEAPRLSYLRDDDLRQAIATAVEEGPQ